MPWILPSFEQPGAAGGDRCRAAPQGPPGRNRSTSGVFQGTRTPPCPASSLEEPMRLAALLILVPSLAACTAGTDLAAPGPIPAAWRGTFGDSVCHPGEVVLFLDDHNTT